MMEPTPLRPDDQVAGGFIAMRLGGQSYEVRVLSMAANRRWTTHLAEQIKAKLGNLEPIESADQVAQLLADQAETMMDLLISYDRMGAVGSKKALPDRKWIDTHATDTECYEAMKRVTAAAYPFGPDLLRIVPELMPMLMQSLSRGVAAATIAMASSRSMSSSPTSTASGPPVTSKPVSPTSSSPSTPRKPRRARSKRRSPS